MLSTNGRIRKVRKALDLTQREFASRIGMKQNSIALIESGRKTSDQTISLICREFHVNETWLRSGLGDMFQPKPKDDLDEILARHGIPHEFRALAESFMDMKPDEQKVITCYMQRVAAAISSGSLSGVPLSTLKAESYVAEQPDQQAIWEAEARAKAETVYHQVLDEKRAETGQSVSPSAD